MNATEKAILNNAGVALQDVQLGNLIEDASGLIQGNKYYVDGNIKFSGNGESWDTPFKTLAEAIAVSHANIASSVQRGWAWRNTIYAKGDRLEEDLVAFPQKTDIVGVGSCDAFVGVGIHGNHAPVNTYYGTRFFNCNFFPNADADIITLTSSGSGTQFIGCRFVGVWGADAAPSALDITAQPMVKIIENDFEGGFTGDVIDVGAGDASGMKIVGNNIMGGADNGIVITGVATVVGATSRGLIKDNNIEVADKVIDSRATSVYNIVGNRCISAEAAAGDAYVIDLTFAVDNHVTFADDSHNVPSIAD